MWPSCPYQDAEVSALDSVTFSVACLGRSGLFSHRRIAGGEKGQKGSKGAVPLLEFMLLRLRRVRIARDKKPPLILAMIE
jgi:hypothetical protein